MKNSIKGLKETRIKALKMIEQNPKNKELKEMTQILDGVIKKLEELEKEDENELVIGMLTVEIDGHRFVKREENYKEIELYTESMLEKDKYHYLQSIPICKTEARYLNNLSNLKKFANAWYKEKIVKGA
ncbi:hypothetical protein PN398_07995 [Romboutsia sp. 1001216sp1]|uniref:hypothetical protein n=1 Tax=unclassified Romboutsia TaxID=2626894 RepID=UPI00189F3488|nr:MULTISPECIES: hypothetical protein [unclassified Romboutsia]MDB8790660.1 hypothetical protein [Romboutsia sp. 1001216sp1]MDB8803279.1 hypothetical protein [Romboutsia sp. 1001216sp1]MDB8814613.1 hypothetical protein [Romboutsia sp. 1001216sp1]